MKISLFPVLLSVFLATSPLLAEKNCVYSYDPKNVQLEWTAFKFTEKLGVKGTFASIKVTGTKPSSTPWDVVSKLQFSIDPNSVDSGVPDRDSKIKTYFFAATNGKPQLVGSFTEVPNSSSGNAFLQLAYKGKKTTVPVKVLWKEETVEVTGTLDVNELGLSKGLAKLNEVCLELHRGADGVSKLWATVDLKVVATLQKSCK